MGADILIITDNNTDLYNDDYFYKNSLSRTFCNLVVRRHEADYEPELDQIGKLTGLDISPLYDMDEYPEEETVEFQLDRAESEAQKQKAIQWANNAKEKCNGNIDKVSNLINVLIDKLGAIENLSSLLLPADNNLSENETYFSDFNSDKGAGYIRNNFGQDLRIFKQYLDLAKSKGVKSVWFHYGG